MATGWRTVIPDTYAPNHYFATLDDVVTAPGSVAEPFWILSPGRRLCATMAYWVKHAVVEVTYDLGDVLDTVPQHYEPVTGGNPGTPDPPTQYVLLQIAGGTVADDLAPDPGGGPGSLNDLAVVLLAPEGT